MATFTHADFTAFALTAFPELRDEFEDAEGMVHLEMAALASRADRARLADDWAAYERAIGLVDRLWDNADEELANALGVSFLEHLEFDGPSGVAAWERLPPRLQAEWRAMDAAMRDAAARAKELGL
jgi:hypothetical protein